MNKTMHLQEEVAHCLLCSDAPGGYGCSCFIEQRYKINASNSQLTLQPVDSDEICRIFAAKKEKER